MMSRLLRATREFLCDTSGLAAVEYAVLLSILLSICMAAIRTIGDRAASAFRAAAQSIDAAGAIGTNDLGSSAGRASRPNAGGTRIDDENNDRGRSGEDKSLK